MLAFPSTRGEYGPTGGSGLHTVPWLHVHGGAPSPNTILPCRHPGGPHAIPLGILLLRERIAAAHPPFGMCGGDRRTLNSRAQPVGAGSLRSGVGPELFNDQRPRQAPPRASPWVKRLRTPGLKGVWVRYHHFFQHCFPPWAFSSFPSLPTSPLPRGRASPNLPET